MTEENGEERERRGVSYIQDNYPKKLFFCGRGYFCVNGGAVKPKIRAKKKKKKKKKKKRKNGEFSCFIEENNNYLFTSF